MLHIIFRVKITFYIILIKNYILYNFNKKLYKNIINILEKCVIKCK